MQKLKLFILCFGITCLVQAQQGKGYNFTFNHMALSVKDVDRSAEFYKNVLKLPEITNRSKLEGVRWFSLGEGKELHLIAIIKEPVTANKALHLALTTTDFDSFVQALAKSAIAYSDWPGSPGKINVRADGIKQVFFQDPDGYWIEINSEASK
jgi:catechol 2,3-dioxygenase-like lactoylglutathione lyase family enzyme